MAKNLLEICTDHIIFHASWSDSKPRGWYTKDNSGNKTYMMLAINFERHGEDETLWAVSFVFWALHVIVGFPKLSGLAKKDEGYGRS